MTTTPATSTTMTTLWR